MRKRGRKTKIESLLSSICNLLSRENNYIIQGDVENIQKILLKKQDLLRRLEEEIDSVKNDGVEMAWDFTKIIERFQQESDKNKLLLEKTIEVQNNILKIIFVDSNENNHSGYSQFGEYESKNSLQGALTLRSDV